MAEKSTLDEALERITGVSPTTQATTTPPPTDLAWSTPATNAVTLGAPADVVTLGGTPPPETTPGAYAAPAPAPTPYEAYTATIQPYKDAAAAAKASISGPAVTTTWNSAPNSSYGQSYTSTIPPMDPALKAAYEAKQADYYNAMNAYYATIPITKVNAQGQTYTEPWPTIATPRPALSASEMAAKYGAADLAAARAQDLKA